MRLLTRLVLGVAATAAVIGADMLATQAETGSATATLIRLGAAVAISLLLIGALLELTGVEWGGRRR